MSTVQPTTIVTPRSPRSLREAWLALAGLSAVLSRISGISPELITESPQV